MKIRRKRVIVTYDDASQTGLVLWILGDTYKDIYDGFLL